MIPLLMLWMASPSHATTIHAHGETTEDAFEHLVDEAAAVVRATVLSTETMVRGRGLVTHYELVVTDCIEGDAEDTLSFALPGGVRADGVMERVSGVPVWSEGADVVVIVPESGQPSLYGVYTLDEHMALHGALPLVDKHNLLLDISRFEKRVHALSHP